MTDERPACPYPSRRQLHAHGAQQTSAPATSANPTTSHHILKVGVLSALTAVTIAIPLTGFVGADSSMALPARVVGTAVASPSWTGASGQSALGESDALTGSQTAASRARVRAPLTLTTCLPSAENANGTRSVQMRTETIVWPIAEGAFEITSPFGPRVSPISGQLLMHEGIDMSAPMGTPLYSIFSGEVVEVSENSRSGALVKIKHTREDGTVFYSMYLHQYMKDILVTTGQQVEGGQAIGAVGSNGWSTGPHLHFEVHDSTDSPVDPETWLSGVGAVYVGQEACS